MTPTSTPMTPPAKLPTNTDIFIERMFRKFQLGRVRFSNPEHQAWAESRWSKEVTTPAPAGQPVLWFLDCLSKSRATTFADSDVLDFLEEAVESSDNPWTKSVVMLWNWNRIVSPPPSTDLDVPAPDQVHGVLGDARRTYTVLDGNLLISEPLERPVQKSNRPAKVKISTRYNAEEEIRTDSKPYEAYLSTMEKVVDFRQISSFCDVGCATGLLLKAVKSRYRNLSVHGYEFFPFHKENADPTIQDVIQVHDLRDPVYDQNTTWDVVNCTEVGEHIDPAYCDQFLENLKTLCGYRSSVMGPDRRSLVLLSWSDSGGENDRSNDPNLQHLNPLTPPQVDAMMRAKSFVKHEEATAAFITESYNHEHFSPWWRKSFGVWVPNWLKVMYG